jgi:hypothetical protein
LRGLRYRRYCLKMLKSAFESCQTFGKPLRRVGIRRGFPVGDSFAQPDTCSEHESAAY